MSNDLKISSNSCAGVYRYGFNGKEKDDEISGSGNSYDYGFRIYNPRIGKFLSVDSLTKEYPWFTPYQFAANTPIMATDLDGLEAKLAIYGLGNGDEAAFRNRAIKLSINPKSGHTTVHSITTGKDFIDLLKTQTNSEGSIASLTLFSHAGPDGIYITSGNGFYDTQNFFGGGGSDRDISDLVNGMETGKIRFEDNAIALFGGCNCAGISPGNNFAQEFTDKTGVTSIASIGNVSPEIIDGEETGRLVSDVEFFKFEKMEDGTVTTLSLGKIINPTDFNVDITIEKMETIKIKSIPQNIEN